MAFLGALPRVPIIFRVTWTLTADSPAITATTLTLTHRDGTLMSVAGTADGVNKWKATLTPTKVGRWRATWTTTPPGGATNDSIYVE